MRTINILALLLTFMSTAIQAQNKIKSSNQSRTIEINNLEGELSISFDDGVITEFNINGEPVSQDLYDGFQNLVNQFGKDIEINITQPTPPVIDNDKSTRLKTLILQYLMDEDIINSATKYKVKLKRKYMKVDGQKVPHMVHHKCLEIFKETYGHRLNFDSKVTYNRNGDKSESSVSIVDID